MRVGREHWSALHLRRPLKIVGGVTGSESCEHCLTNKASRDMHICRVVVFSCWCNRSFAATAIGFADRPIGLYERPSPNRVYLPKKELKSLNYLRPTHPAMHACIHLITWSCELRAGPENVVCRYHITSIHLSTSCSCLSLFR